MDQYFAALEADRLGTELQARVDAYFQWIMTTGRLARWRLAYDTYYGRNGLHQTTHITAAGKKGELSLVGTGEYRNLVQHLLVFAFQSRPSLETVAINTDSKSKAQSYVARGLVEYFRRDGRIDDNCREATEISLLMDSGWVFNEWDVLLGNEVAVDQLTGQVVRQGDIRSRARTPLDVVVDFTKPQGNSRDWILVRDPVNKYDLAAQYPELADRIVRYTRDYTKDALFRFGELWQYESSVVSPDVDVWTFYHRRSPALPNGRMFQFIDPRLHLFDGPIPYRKLPGNRVCPTEMMLSALGYSNTNDLLGLQAIMDALVSAAVTNMTTVGVNNIWSKPNENFDFQQLAAGMNYLQSDNKPETLILNQLPPEWFNLANWVIARMEAVSGVNATARGNVQGKDFSGAAMALLQSMAIQFNNGLMRSVNRLIEDCGNDVIQLTQDFAKEKRLGMIIGLQNRYMMREYSAKDVEGIQRVYCRQSNPTKDTTAGKLQLLQEYMKVPGLVTTADQINEVVETGSLDSATEPGRNARLTIDQENEAILAGEVPNVMFFDNHAEHMKGHSRLFASPEDRNDPELVRRAKEHTDWHLREWQQADPNVLAIIGCPPYQPPPMPMGPPPPGGPGGPPALPPGPGPDAAPQLPPTPAADQAGVAPPDLPTNSLTGEQWNPVDGGLGQGQ